MFAPHCFRLKRLSPVLVLAAPLVLYGCGNTPTAKGAAPHPAAALFARAIQEAPLVDSIVREGDLVSYVVPRSAVIPADTRFEVICAGDSVTFPLI